jgi:hypothetical protein
MGCASAACDFKPLRLQRRPLGDGDVLIEMKFCGICHSDGACSSNALRPDWWLRRMAGRTRRIGACWLLPAASAACLAAAGS